MTPSEFYDENLIRLSGLPWADFVELIEMDYQGFSLSSRSASIASQGNHQIIDNFSIYIPFVAHQSILCITSFLQLHALLLHHHPLNHIKLQQGKL